MKREQELLKKLNSIVHLLLTNRAKETKEQIREEVKKEMDDMKQELNEVRKIAKQLQKELAAS